MDSDQRAARIFGALFILTFVTSIAGLLLYGPVLDEKDYIVNGGADGEIALGALLEIGLVITNIGTSVVLFPIAKRYSETLALSWVASRIVESTIIAVGAISLLSIVTLRQESQQPALSGALPVARRVAGGNPRLDVPIRARLLRRRATGSCSATCFTLRARAAVDGDVRSRRRPSDLRVVDRRAVRAYEQDGAHFLFCDPRDRVRGFDHHLHHRQGLQGVPILDDTRYAGGASGSAAMAAQ